MGKLCEFQSFVGVSSSRKIYLLNKKNLKITILEVPLIKSVPKQRENVKIKNDGEDEIVCFVPSKDGQYLAAAMQSKKLILWKVSSWSFLKEETLIKRPMAIAFTMDSSKVVVADKNGDVYSFSVNEDNSYKETPDPNQNPCIDEEPGPEPLLGHLSMLLDLAVTDDGKFLITSDRDEKIRVSSYPNCYNIHTFCLGHTEFVSQIKLLPNRNDRLLSASGDGKVKLWNHLSGECFATLDVRLRMETFPQQYFKDSGDPPEEVGLKHYSTFISKIQILSLDSQENILAVSFYRLPVMLFYKIKNSDSFLFLHSYETTSPPLDFIFLERGEILAYLDTSENVTQNPLALFRFSEDLNCIQQIDDHPILTFGQDYRDKLKAKDVWSLDANALFKHKYDNVADYQKRKQERLNNTQTIFPRKRKAFE